MPRRLYPRVARSMSFSTRCPAFRPEARALALQSFASESVVRYYFAFGVWRDNVLESVLNRNPLHLIERDLIAPPIVKPRGARGFVCGHSLCNLKLAAVSQVRGNASGPKRVASDQGLDAGTRGASPDHEVHLRLGDLPFGELLRPAPGRPEEGSAFLFGDAGGLQVWRHVLLRL